MNYVRSTKSKNWVKCTMSGVQNVRTLSDLYKIKEVRSTKSKNEVRFIKRIRSGVKSENQSICIRYRIRPDVLE